ncbi:MAG: hypothetical protein PHR96_01730 [Clostridia bacterium]|nr:hypothetical protein [Clostridia bacterium]
MSSQTNKASGRSGASGQCPVKRTKRAGVASQTDKASGRSEAKAGRADNVQSNGQS